LRQLCNDFVNGKVSEDDVKKYDFTDAKGRGQRKKFPARQGDESEDDNMPLKSLSEVSVSAFDFLTLFFHVLPVSSVSCVSATKLCC
jgi:hypothetical protein